MHSGQPYPASKAGWLATCFLEVRRALLTQWTSDYPPNIANVKADLLGLFCKDKLDATLCHQDLTPHFDHKWDHYIAKVFPASDRTPPPPPQHYANPTSHLIRGANLIATYERRARF